MWLPCFGIVAGLAILVLLCASLPYMSIGRGVIVHGLFEVYGVQNLDLVAVLQHCVATFKHDSSFRIGDHIGTVTL